MIGLTKTRLVMIVAVALAGIVWVIVSSTGEGSGVLVDADQLVDDEDGPAQAEAGTSVSPPTTTSIERDLIAELVAQLNDRQIAQQLVVWGGEGDQPAERIIEALGNACVGGVFVTKSENWMPEDSPEAAARAISGIEQSASECSIKPLVATDAEAGDMVLKVPVDPLPAPATLEDGYQADPAVATESLISSAQQFADSLNRLGVHVNFGVVADVDVADGFYMERSGRSFGDDAATVTGISEALVEGHCRGGVAPALKHFPNQGSTVEDPHAEDSLAVHGREQWSRLGAIPYRNTRVPIVMAGHVRYPGVDGGVPASHSPTIISEWLRKDIGFDGVVITDDLESMRGAAVDLSAAGRGMAALTAGADMLLYVSSQNASSVVDAIVAAMDRDADFAEQARSSAHRVLKLKAAFGLVDGVDAATIELCGERD